MKAATTYNLLSSPDLAINGRFNYLDRDKESGLVLDRVGIRFGDDTISMSNQGILLINGKEFKKGKVDLDGNITLKDGIYSLDADDYTVKLKALGSKQIRLDIEAEDVS